MNLNFFKETILLYNQAYEILRLINMVASLELFKILYKKNVFMAQANIPIKSFISLHYIPFIIWYMLKKVLSFICHFAMILFLSL